MIIPPTRKNCTIDFKNEYLTIWYQFKHNKPSNLKLPNCEK